MLDRYNRKINYLRISVTDRCNLRCVYCMPEEGIQLISHKEILSFEEITEIVKYCAGKGINKIRITGGEPLVRKGIVSFVSMISAIKGVDDLAMTTNGILLDQYAGDLAKAGLQRVNISLDTMDPEKYTTITRGGDIRNVLRGIEAAKSAGLVPVKINCVVFRSSDEPDARKVKQYCADNDLHIRYIHKMDLETGEFSIVEGGEGGDCEHCNRLRLTANGKIKPCLFSDLEFDVRDLGIEEAISLALKNKPEKGTLSCSNKFYNIGG